jgi:hypothetical protein
MLLGYGIPQLQAEHAPLYTAGACFPLLFKAIVEVLLLENLHSWT